MADETIRSAGELSRKYGFGTVEWQEAMLENINKKRTQGIELDKSDKAFIDVQTEHNQNIAEGE